MFFTILCLWFWTVLYFNPRILALLFGPENILAKLALISFLLLLDLFWYYALYHVVIIAFAYFENTPISKTLLKDNQILIQNPSVALLYTTYNDFQENAVLSCINQEYANFQVFILDDSTDADYKNRIDIFAGQYKKKVIVIRRKNRNGYKAGNINNALNQIKGFEYFSISDADSILPKNYISGLLPYFKGNKIAFVQARQESNPEQKSTFAQQLGYQVSLHCDYYMKTKNRYGYVMFYGHGAMLRTDVYHEAGGFPEIATEDLAYSMLIRERGYFGVSAEDVVCYEDFPPTYQQYRRRNEKWIRGTTECLFKYYPSFVKSKNITWMEKVDVLSSACLLLLPFPFFILLLLVGILLPFFYYNFRFQGLMFRMPIEFDNSLLKLMVKTTSNLFWSIDFFVLLIISIIGPMIPPLVELVKYPKQRFKFIIMHAFMFYATEITSSLNLFAYLLSRSATFPVTGHTQKNTQNIRVESNRDSFREFTRNPVANHKITVILEAVFAVIFFIISMLSKNIWFLLFSVGLAISIILIRFGFENRNVRYLVSLPLVLLVMIIILIGKTLQ
ncbi:MAG: glycosyltransferase [Candidatus Omnitrophica bacterium]|nr:glycosyltransferase [Candidatus Omnitrophota bacterium]